MTKIIWILRMTGMTGDWDVNRTMMTGMSRMTGVATFMDKSPWDSNAIIIFFVWVP